MKQLHPLEGFFLFFLIIILFLLLANFASAISILQGLILSHLILFFLVPLLYTILRRVPVQEIFPLSWPGIKGILGGFFAGLGALLLGSALVDLLTKNYLPVPEETIREIMELIKAQGFSRAIILFAVIPAIFEEWFYRGFLLSAFRSRMGLIFSVFLSSLLFGFSHTGKFSDYLRGIATAWLGFVLALLVVWFQSLIPAMIGHFLVNFSIILTVFHYPSLSGIEGYSGETAKGLLLVGAFSLLLAFYVFAPRRKK